MSSINVSKIKLFQLRAFVAVARLLGAVIVENALHPSAIFTFLDTVKQVGEAMFNSIYSHPE